MQKQVSSGQQIVTDQILIGTDCNSITDAERAKHIENLKRKIRSSKIKAARSRHYYSVVSLLYILNRPKGRDTIYIIVFYILFTCLYQVYSVLLIEDIKHLWNIKSEHRIWECIRNLLLRFFILILIRQNS